MDELMLLLLFPLGWPIVSKFVFHTEITWREMGLQIGIVVIATTVLWFGGRLVEAADTEIWNGQVTGKSRVWVPCAHSYTCNCRESCTGSGKDRRCTTTCETCYEHLNDWDWRVETDIGNFDVARVDSRGAIEPKRWSVVVPGQPVAREHSFRNYIKAAPDSLFHKNSSIKERFAGQLPPYPRVYDYHYANRVIPVGVAVPDLKEWNLRLALALRQLGPKRQANVVVILANAKDADYATALEEHWLGGKKNDIVVVLGVPEYPNIAWTRIISWTDRESFKVSLRDALFDLKTADSERVVSTIEHHTHESFVRRPMKDFEYLWDEVSPPGWLTTLIAILAIAMSVYLTRLFRRINV